MAFSMFSFIFKIMSEYMNFWLFNAMLTDTVSFGLFIMFVFLLLFFVNKLLAMQREEYGYQKEFEKKEKMANMGKHAYYKPKHEKK